MAILEDYLTGVLKLITEKNSEELKQYLRVEPVNLPDVFQQLCKELQTSYQDSDALDDKVDSILPLPEQDEEENSSVGAVWPGFQAFMKEYLEYWRNVDFTDLLDTYDLLSDLTNSCITALSHVSYGIIVLPTTHQLCDALTRLATQLDKRPDLTRQLRHVASDDDGEGRKSLVEGTAESIQRAFTMCLTERSSTRSGIKDGKPEGKKIGIYSFANLVLRLLFQCRKTRLANQIFTNISQNSPPLGLYSSKQRVTFLYYLGRFFFSNNHFYRAQLCLQAAYNQCHSQFLKQKRLILIYLVATNMILGRFPSATLLARPEAVGLAEKFVPVANAIRKGNIVAFKRALGPESGNERWFFQKGILLSLITRCGVLVWRSLARRVFLLTYEFPSDPTSRKAPTLDLASLVSAAQYCQKILEGWQIPASLQPGRIHTNALFMKPADLEPPPGGVKRLVANEGTIFSNKMPDLLEVEAIVSSLVQQGLLYGFISHGQGKFAIIGAKQRGGPLNAGFPVVWEVLKAKAEKDGRDKEVPGWVQHERRQVMGGVVNLSGIARPVG